MKKRSHFAPVSWSLIAAMAMGAAGCKRNVPEAAHTAGSTASLSDQLTQTLNATDWSNQWNDLSKRAMQLKDEMVPEQLRQLLSSSNFSSPIADLQKALEAGDYTQVDTLARKLDGLLDSQGALATAFEALKVHQQKGAAAAQRFIDDYALREDLTAFQKEAVQKLSEAQTALTSTDYRPYIALAILFACASKLGPHEGAALGGIIVQTLFPEISHTGFQPVLPSFTK